jgi:hypothetical protein
MTNSEIHKLDVIGPLIKTIFLMAANIPGGDHELMLAGARGMNRWWSGRGREPWDSCGCSDGKLQFELHSHQVMITQRYRERLLTDTQRWGCRTGVGKGLAPAVNPAAFNPNLARSLNTLSLCPAGTVEILFTSLICLCFQEEALRVRTLVINIFAVVLGVCEII